MDNLEQSIQGHDKMLHTNVILSEDVDYTIAEGHMPFFNMLDTLNTSIVVVLDYCRNDYFYVSKRFNNVFGFNVKLPIMDHNWFRRRFHPEDYVINLAGMKAREFLLHQPVENRKNFKLIHDFRMRNDENRWIRLIVQDYILELDKKGNIWLNMKLFDMSPIQDLTQPGRSMFCSKLTGEVIFSMEGKREIPECISKREKQVLSLIADGLRSKEIAERLFISTNTVNNHRKSILEKLKVSNSSEAVRQAMKLGMI